MSADDLLLWMSARGSGSWAQFRAAVERLFRAGDDASEQDDEPEIVDSTSLPLHQELRLNLERFGYAEFFDSTDNFEWRVAPPVLAVSDSGRMQTAFILGARSDALINRIKLVLGNRPLSVESSPHCPGALSFQSDDPTLFDTIASETGLLLQADAPTAILSAIPAISRSLLRNRAEIPIGREWMFERFSERELRWISSTREAMNTTAFGLFRLRFRFRSEILLRWSGGTYAVPLQDAKFISLRRVRARVLSYERATSTLSLPAICRPPMLIERALVLCSGRLPDFEVRSGSHSLLHYQRVPRTVARTISALLRQELP